jgi:hypothetical protein
MLFSEFSVKSLNQNCDKPHSGAVPEGLGLIAGKWLDASNQRLELCNLMKLQSISSAKPVVRDRSDSPAVPSSNRSRRNLVANSRTRNLLLASAAAGALLIAAPAQGNALPPGCAANPAKTVITCTGANDGAGIVYNSGDLDTPGTVTTLTVSGIDKNIVAPADSGISIDSSDQSVTLQSYTGTKTITAKGDNASGINAYTRKTGGTASVTATGERITSEKGDGITVFAKTGNIDINSSVKYVDASTTGVTQGDAIDAQARSGSITVDASGKLTAKKGRGVYLYAKPESTGQIKLTGSADISGNNDAVRISGVAAPVIVNLTGVLQSDSGRGVYIPGAGDSRPGSGRTASVSVTTSKDITSSGKSFQITSVSGDVSIAINGGTVTSKKDEAVSVSTKTGKIDIDTSNTSEVIAALDAPSPPGTPPGGDAISARSTEGGEITIDALGDVTSTTRNGIHAQTSGDSPADITITTGKGAIKGYLNGIEGRSNGKVTVTAEGGTITSQRNDGIWAFGTSVKVTSDADITGKTNGIRVGSDAGVVTVEANSGKITGTGSNAHAIVATTGSGEINISGGANLVAKESLGSGIFGSASGGKITVDVSGKIESAKYRGINLTSNSKANDAGALTVKGSADISAFDDAVTIYTVAAPIIVDVSSKITSSTGDGISASSDSGAIGVTTKKGSSVTGNQSGIQATTASGNITIVSDGNINANGYGIDLRTSIATTVQVTSSGDISGIGGAAAQRGIVVQPNKGGASQIIVNAVSGNLNVEAVGILATSDRDGANISIVSGAAIKSEQYGITGAGHTTVINSSGIIQADQFTGIVGSGFTVSITSSGAIIAGDKGIDAFSYGESTVSALGNVTALNGSAVVARGNANLSVTVGAVATGAAAAAGVQFGEAGRLAKTGTFVIANGDGANNTLSITKSGHVRNADTAPALDKLAIWGQTGNETVLNEGIVTGSVDLGAGSNSFDNRAGGLFVMGSRVMIGAGRKLSNSGTIAPGGDNNVLTVTLTGNVEQTAGGVWRVDVNAVTKTADLIRVSGTASLAGTVIANDLGTPVTIDQEYLIMQAEGGVTPDSLLLDGNVRPTLSLAFRCSTPGEACTDQVWLVASEAPPPPPPAPPTAPTERSDLRPQPYLQAAMSGIFAAQGFSDTLMGCREREGTYAYIADTQCLWLDTGGSYLERTSSGNQFAADQTAWWLGGGVNAELSETVHAGLGVRYENISQDVHDNAHNDGWWGHLGASLSYNPGPWLLAGAVAGGIGRLDTRRNLSSDEFTGVVEGQQDVSYLQGKLRAGYLFDYGAWYLKPLVDLDAIWMSYGDVNEQGGSGALRIDGEEQTVLSATPRLEIGGQGEMQNGSYVRPYAQLGVVLYADTGFSMQAQFLDESLDIPAFTTVTELDSVLADVTLGLDVLMEDGWNIRVAYDGQFGETTVSHAGTLRAEWRF